jgi:hypothetical protein
MQTANKAPRAILKVVQAGIFVMEGKVSFVFLGGGVGTDKETGNNCFDEVLGGGGEEEESKLPDPLCPFVCP